MNFDSLILKIASRCNLNCSYCFMYNLGDTTFKKQPKFMSPEIVDSVLEKTKNYIRKYNKKTFSFTFHGGEPLLAPKDFFAYFMGKLRGMEKELKDVKISLDLQTNGVLLNEEWITLFKKYNIAPSVSVDGTKKAHDMYRVDHKGRGSYDAVFNGASLLKNQMGFLDIACVININEDPLETYESFKKMNASYVNYLIPDYTHDSYPFNKEETKMANWLIQLFDIWINDPKRYTIPMFVGLLNSLMRISQNNQNESTVLIIETNGEIEAVDSLKACGHGFTKTGLNIVKNDLDDIEATSLGQLYFNEFTTKLSSQCQQCPLNEICGGGRLVHRYSKNKGFNNPSVYCKDLIVLIAHVQNYFVKKFSELHDKEGVEAMVPHEIIDYLNTMKYTESQFVTELEYFSKAHYS